MFWWKDSSPLLGRSCEGITKSPETKSCREPFKDILILLVFVSQSTSLATLVVKAFLVLWMNLFYYYLLDLSCYSLLSRNTAY